MRIFVFSSDQSSYGGGEEMIVDLSANTTYYLRIASKTGGPVGVAISGLNTASSRDLNAESGCFIDTVAAGCRVFGLDAGWAGALAGAK